MKSERRHELQHNDLAEWILAGYERIVPYRNSIFGVSLLVIVLAIGLSFWHSHSVAQAGEAWGSLGLPVFQPAFQIEQTIPMMQHTVQTYPGGPAAEWAQVFAGDTALMVGTNKILVDKTVGVEYLTQARKLYEQALDTLTIPGAREQAMFGRARAIESSIQKKADRDEAVAAYQELNKNFPNGMFKAIAEQRIEQLGKPDSLVFYDALAQYKPKPKAKTETEPPKNPLQTPGPLLDNPPDEPLVPKTPVRSGGSQSGTTPGLPAPDLTPLEPAKSAPAQKEAGKTETPKTEPAKPQAVKPDATKTEVPKADAPKAEPPKKDK